MLLWVRFHASLLYASCLSVFGAMLLCVRLRGRWSARGAAGRCGAPCVVAARVTGGEDHGRAWREPHLRPAHKDAGRPPLVAWACGARARWGRGRRGRRGRGRRGHCCDFADGRHAVVARPRWLGPRAAARRRRRGGGVGRRAARVGVLRAGASGAGNGSSGRRGEWLQWQRSPHARFPHARQCPPPPSPPVLRGHAASFTPY